MFDYLQSAGLMFQKHKNICNMVVIDMRSRYEENDDRNLLVIKYNICAAANVARSMLERIVI